MNFPLSNQTSLNNINDYNIMNSQKIYEHISLISLRIIIYKR